MWDFSIGRTLVMVLRTWPFVLFRMIVYFGITIAYIFATGTGAGVGYGVGHIFGGPEGPGTFAFGGGAISFFVVSAVVYWLREYILYVVKAGHIAVLVRLIDRQDVPGGQGQIAYATAIVKQRFVEANVLFALDQLVKGVLVAIARMTGGIAALLPIPGLSTLIAFFNSVVRMALTYVDEIIIGYNIRRESTQPYETARQALVLYAQNGRTMLKNALWLAIFMWVIALVVFLTSLAPAAAVLYYMPGQIAGWSFVLAIVFTWAVSAAFIEPFCIAALMQVYFRVIEGQRPDPAWDSRLAEVSGQFRQIRDQALASMGGSQWRPAAGGS